MNPYKELGIRYQGIEYEGLDEEIKEAYEKKKETYQNQIEEIYGKYPNLPQEIEALQELDLIEFLRQDGENVEFSVSALKRLEVKCQQLESSITRLIKTKEELDNLNKAYRVIKSVYSRLVFFCEREKIRQGCSPELVQKVEEKPIEINKKPIVIDGVSLSAKSIIDINLEDGIMRHMGKLEYTNWTSVCQSYINKYMIMSNQQASYPLYTNIPSEYSEDLEFIAFLKRVMLDEKYLDYVIQNNGGYLGSPNKKDGNYILEFNNEDLVAVQKFAKEKAKQVDVNKPTSEYEDISL